MPNSLHLLHTKSWHVGRADNIAKVKRDEEQKEQEDQADKINKERITSQIRIERLRKRLRPDDSAADKIGSGNIPSLQGDSFPCQSNPTLTKLQKLRGPNLLESLSDTRSPFYLSSSHLPSLPKSISIPSSRPRIINVTQFSQLSRDASIKHREDPLTTIRKALEEKRRATWGSTNLER
jgi:hypothetical protein